MLIKLFHKCFLFEKQYGQQPLSTLSETNIKKKYWVRVSLNDLWAHMTISIVTIQTKLYFPIALYRHFVHRNFKMNHVLLLFRNCFNCHYKTILSKIFSPQLLCAQCTPDTLTCSIWLIFQLFDEDGLCAPVIYLCFSIGN